MGKKTYPSSDPLLSVPLLLLVCRWLRVLGSSDIKNQSAASGCRLRFRLKFSAASSKSFPVISIFIDRYNAAYHVSVRELWQYRRRKRRTYRMGGPQLPANQQCPYLPRQLGL